MASNKAVVSVSLNRKYLNILDAEVKMRNKILLEKDEFADTVTRSDLLRYTIEQYCIHLEKKNAQQESDK